MATFYLIPPRECLEQAVSEFLARILPGVPCDHTVTEAILAAVEFEANRTGDVYLIHREDLPGGRDAVGMGEPVGAGVTGCDTPEVRPAVATMRDT